MPIINEKNLLEAINSFQMRSPKGELFWPPYVRNDNFTQVTTAVRGLGKSYPVEIQKSVDYIYKLYPKISTDEARKRLIDGSLDKSDLNYKGIDCSGFAYIVFERLYRKLFNAEFYSVLSVPKEHVLNGALNLVEWKEAYALSEAEADSLPTDVPMEWVIKYFKRKPINLCRVNGMVSDYSSFPITSPPEYGVGDIIHIINPTEPIPHLAIISRINQLSVEAYHSTRTDPTEIGGVQQVIYTIDELEACKSIAGKILAVRRLKTPHITEV